MADAQSSNDESAETMRSVLHRISKEIRDFRAEHKEDLHKLKEELKEDMKTELKDLKQEIYRELSANSTRIQVHETRLNEAETRIDEGETINMAMKDALIKSIKEQKAMREKLVDLEGRSRRNNIRIYGVPEEKEEAQGVHGIKRALKEKGVRFQTPLDKMRIHWDSNTHIQQRTRRSAGAEEERLLRGDTRPQHYGAGPRVRGPLGGGFPLCLPTGTQGGEESS
ncbi:hypothetical protein AAFF_G00399910 [Aldrovandia affinis]|uniref:Uncharacterized protein n=1 Tax=Aldrovandia affinis TaxID=143900 RepID=A0AAD7R404_9TELE|nr:hypothetical protein AAFF_G00399910 [Aldrovandia affinis]